MKMKAIKQFIDYIHMNFEVENERKKNHNLDSWRGSEESRKKSRVIKILIKAGINVEFPLPFRTNFSKNKIVRWKRSGHEINICFNQIYIFINTNFLARGRSVSIFPGRKNNKLIGHSCSFSVVFNNDQKRALYSIYLLAAIGNNRYEAPVTFGEDCYAAPSTKLKLKLTETEIYDKFLVKRKGLKIGQICFWLIDF